MKQATVGFRVHSGWSAVVAVCLEKGAPVVLHRQRVQLVETFTYRFRQPYHTGEKMALAAAREFIAGVREQGRESCVSRDSRSASGVGGARLSAEPAARFCWLQEGRSRNSRRFLRRTR